MKCQTATPGALVWLLPQYPVLHSMGLETIRSAGAETAWRGPQRT